MNHVATALRLPTLLACVASLVGLTHCGSGGSHDTTGSGASTGSGGSSDTTSSSSGGGSSSSSSSSGTGGSSSSSSSSGTGGAGGSPVLGPTVGDFVGVNGFIDDPGDLLPPLGNVREYHNWMWSEGNGDSSYPGYPNNKNSFVLFGGAWNWDTYYGNLKAAGVFGYPVIQGSVPWLANNAVPPVANGADATNPASYAAHADEMFQYAARYGSTQVAQNLLKLAAGQPVATGLGTLRYIEDWNEQDAWWVHSDGSPLFSTDQYAAMASADYDGHKGSMGMTVGMKNADPNIKMVMGGLAGHAKGSVTWEASVESSLAGVRTWADAHRGGSFPADVINAHYYSFGPNSAAVSPEDDQIEAMMSKLVQYRDAHLAGKELWLTEFGYDTDPQSVLHAPAIGSNSAQVVQGQWIIRFYLALMAAGFDRAFLFVTRDPCSGSNSACSTQFGTSGVLGPKGAETPKTAYYYIATFRSRLASLAWLGKGTSSDPSVRIAKLRDPKSEKGAYVVWSGTSNANVVHGFSLDVGAATQAKAVTLVDGQANGVEAPLDIASGAVTLDVSETPTIVLVDAIQ